VSLMSEGSPGKEKVLVACVLSSEKKKKTMMTNRS
jgi:hypothetical protein